MSEGYIHNVLQKADNNGTGNHRDRGIGFKPVCSIHNII